MTRSLLYCVRASVARSVLCLLAAGVIYSPAVVSSASASPVPAGAPAKVLKLELKWTPKEAPNLPTIDATGGLYTIRLEPFVDKRDKPHKIGENPEKNVEVITDDDVAVFVHDVLSRELKGLGLDLTDTGGERTLKGEIVYFWARDAGSYSATVRVKFTLLDGATEIWTGIVQGTGENWGRSLKPINYTETISGALSQLMTNLLQTPELRAALKKGKS